MEEKISKIIEKLKSIEKEITKEEIIKDRKKYGKLMKEYNRLSEIVKTWNEILSIKKDIKDLKEMSRDPEMREEAMREVESLEELLSIKEKRLKASLIPRDPDDNKNCIMEIRNAAGGEESALFASELFRMYSKYIEKRRWNIEILSSNRTELGGIKEIVYLVKGEEAFRYLKYESGVHRVQRVPVTESSGRIHTSTVTVAVLPEAEDVDIEIKPEELKIESFRASGRGGQHVNVTDSAVRITHLPTGIVVSCQDERSQHRNKEKAMRILRARVLQHLKEQEESKISERRRRQLGTGERSEKIRTYNFPQNRVTDHRINLTVYALDRILDGELDLIIEPLLEKEAEKLMEYESEEFNKKVS